MRPITNNFPLKDQIFKFMLLLPHSHIYLKVYGSLLKLCGCAIIASHLEGGKRIGD